MNGNQAILLTGSGASAIAVLRLTGPATTEFLRRRFSRPTAEGRCVHGELSDGADVIDDPVVVLGPGAAWADLNLHGGPWVVKAVTELARRDGFEIVAWEHTPAAFDADDELEREMLAAVPLARTEEALKALLAQLPLWRAWRAGRGPGPDPADVSLYRLLHPPRVVLVGEPNAGKSTLANRLFAQEKSITADLPGTTRDWVDDLANLDGLVVTLIDTPGLRPTGDPIEAEAIRRAREQVAQADLVVLVLDGPITLVDQFPDALSVMNKCDLGTNAKYEPRPSGSGGGAAASAHKKPAAPAPLAHTRGSSCAPLSISAKTGEGIDALIAAIRMCLGCPRQENHGPRWWTNQQQHSLRLGAFA